MNNEVTLIGRFNSDFSFDHSLFGEKYYRIILAVTRTSGTVDKIPVMVSERLILSMDYDWGSVCIKGQFRSFVSHDLDKNRLLVYVFALHIEQVDSCDLNDIFLEGIINREPTYRITPLGREISDIILEVPREYGKTDFIPCVCWGRTAKFVSGLSTGQGVRIAGRIQSREYQKNDETKIAYEVSVNLVEMI